MDSSSANSTKSAIKSVVELVATVAVAVGLALLIQAFIVKPYKIPSSSMEPTLNIGQRILANRLAGNPGLGDIVVFHPPTGADSMPAVCGAAHQGGGYQQACDTPTTQQSSQTFIKRVVGLPGDHLQILNGAVIRNGKPEPKFGSVACNTGPTFCNFPQTIVVPPGHYFMMGDNRGVSDDSRFWGPVPGSWIIGTAFFTYWPPDRIGTL
jgi:signal peptidase I